MSENIDLIFVPDAAETDKTRLVRLEEYARQLTDRTTRCLTMVNEQLEELDGSVNTMLRERKGIVALLDGRIDNCVGKFTNAEKNSEIFNDYTGNTASAAYAHAEGRANSAAGAYSHAEGERTQATGAGSHAEGRSTIASGTFSHAEGYGGRCGGTVTVNGQQITGGGDYAHAEGHSGYALGYASHAEGGFARAAGQYSHAEGMDTAALGDSSHAEGYKCSCGGIVTVSGQQIKGYGGYAHAEGQECCALGHGSHAQGYLTKAIGQYSHTEGQGSIAYGIQSHAEGGYTVTEGVRSHAEGDASKALGPCSHAEGKGTLAQGEESHAEGGYTVAVGTFSHAEGMNTEAAEDCAHAEGSSSKAGGYVSHAEGSSTEALGYASHAQNQSTVAATDASTAIGRHNRYEQDGETLDFALTVGNGSYEERSNALELDWEGNLWVAGSISFGGGLSLSYNELSDKPQINGRELSGILTADELSLAELSYVDEKADETFEAAAAYTDGTEEQLRAELDGHFRNTANPHAVTAEQIGLGNVENKSADEILSGFEIGGANLICDSGFTQDTFGKALFESTFSVGQYDYSGAQWAGLSRSGYTGTARAYVTRNLSESAEAIPYKAGDSFVLTAMIYAEGLTNDNSAVIFQGETTAERFLTLNLPMSAASGEWTRYEVKFTAAQDGVFKSFYIALGGNGTLKVARLKLEKGGKPTDWSAAPEDVLSLARRVAALEGAVLATGTQTAGYAENNEEI